MSDSFKHTALFVVGVVALAIVGTLGWNQHTRYVLMSQDLQLAADKGIEPMAVRCAYAEPTDSICLVYAATKAFPKEGRISADRVEMKR